VHAAAKLQPGFQAADNLMRKADSIFEKEQAFLLEAAVKKPASKLELYVNDHGYVLINICFFSVQIAHSKSSLGSSLKHVQ
jgi:hypothetical protein